MLYRLVNGTPYSLTCYWLLQYCGWTRGGVAHLFPTGCGWKLCSTTTQEQGRRSKLLVWEIMNSSSHVGDIISLAIMNERVTALLTVVFLISAFDVHPVLSERYLPLSLRDPLELSRSWAQHQLHFWTIMMPLVLLQTGPSQLDSILKPKRIQRPPHHSALLK